MTAFSWPLPTSKSFLLGSIGAALPSIVDDLDLRDLGPECLIDLCHAEDRIGVQTFDLLQKIAKLYWNGLLTSGDN